MTSGIDYGTWTSYAQRVPITPIDNSDAGYELQRAIVH